MINVVCTIITAFSMVICAVVTQESVKNKKMRQIKDLIAEKNAKQRVKESHLLLSMLDANSKLTVGVAIALKNGKCNGEVKEGLNAVEKANKSYKKFLEEIAIEQIKREGLQE